ncbi:hypothetical protein [Corynebacterium sp. Marseille-P4321]|nr:hypothetical protein [Corynebacterium sp. Marseille-P4321]
MVGTALVASARGSSKHKLLIDDGRDIWVGGLVTARVRGTIEL